MAEIKRPKSGKESYKRRYETLPDGKAVYPLPHGFYLDWQGRINCRDLLSYPARGRVVIERSLQQRNPA